MDYSLQGNRKTEEGEDHPDRDAQFRHINRQVQRALRQGQPVISVDTKKKELVGNFENKGRQWRRQGSRRKRSGPRFSRPVDAAGLSLRHLRFGPEHGLCQCGNRSRHGQLCGGLHPGLVAARRPAIVSADQRLLITADGGGSNGYRVRLWKWELQRLADQTGLEIAVCHFPPGTSKWNKVEHRLFSFISSNWRGEPLRDYETIVGLIACTTTAKG